MTTVLHLGIIDVPYSAASYGAATKKRKMGRAKRGKANAPKTSEPGTQTTGDVAEWLENRYHVMEVFFEDVGAELFVKALEHSYAGAVENIIHGGAPADKISLSAEAESEIEAAFKMYLSQQEMDGVQPGVPTGAAQRGVSHRFLHPYARRAPRPSFIDTGLYQANFKAWVDE